MYWIPHWWMIKIEINSDFILPYKKCLHLLWRIIYIYIMSKRILIGFNIRCVISLNTLFLFLCLSFPSRFRVPFFSFFGSHNIHNTCSVVLLVKAAFVDRRPFKKVSFTHKDMPSTLYYKTEKRNSIYIVWLCCIVLLGLL